MSRESRNNKSNVHSQEAPEKEKDTVAENVRYREKEENYLPLFINYGSGVEMSKRRKKR